MAREPGHAAGGARLRQVLNRARGAFGAAFSIGPGYEQQFPAAQASYDVVRGYYLDLRHKAAAEFRPRISGHGEIVEPGPTAIAQRALGIHERWLAGDEQARAPFLAEVDALHARARQQDAMLLWEYQVDVPKFDRRSPWHSAMAQGQAASAFVRAYVVTSDPRWSEAARAAVAPLTGAGEGLALVTHTDAGPVLEEAATEPPSHILNGWIFALWGLWDVAVGLDDRAARTLFDRSATALSKMLGRYDVGWWSRYSLYPPVAPDLAKPFYHRIHILQLPVLHRMTGEALFASTAERWARYDRAANRARAVTSKGVSMLRTRRARARRPSDRPKSA